MAGRLLASIAVALAACCILISDSDAKGVISLPGRCSSNALSSRHANRHDAEGNSDRGDGGSSSSSATSLIGARSVRSYVLRSLKKQSKRVWGARQLAIQGGHSPSPAVATLDGDSSSGGDISGKAAESVSDTCSVIISTSLGSTFLDKKKRLNVPRNTTVSELKELLHQKFPGGLLLCRGYLWVSGTWQTAKRLVNYHNQIQRRRYRCF